MYKVVAKYNGAYAVMDSSTGDVEALTAEELKSVLYFGTEIMGVDYTPEGDLNETIPIQEMTDEDMSNPDLDEEDDWEDFDEDLYDEDEDDEEIYEETDNFEEDEEVDEDFETIDEEADDIYDDIYDTDEYYDDEFESRSTVQKLYDFLDPEQVKLLKRYYLWYSQKIFVNAKKDPTLGMKDKNRLMRKKEDLNTLRNTGGMWHYAGFVDMGYDGAGYCTLGHPLRYMHIAWDVSQSDIESTFFGDNYDNDFEELLDSNNCITFGIKCISDFFEVDAECTQSLQRAQRESLKDMALMYEQYEAGEVKNICESFKLMDEVVRRIKRIDGKGLLFGGDDYKPILPDGYIQFYTQFRQTLMPVPKSLIQEIRDNIIGWHSHKFYGSIGSPGRRFTDNLVRMFGGKLDTCKNDLVFKSNIFYYQSSWTELVYRYYTQLFAYEICGHFKFNGAENSDEGGKSQKVREELGMLYTSQKKQFARDAEFTMDYADKVASTCSQVESLRETFKSLVDEINSYEPELDKEKYIKKWVSKSGKNYYSYAIERMLSHSESFGRSVGRNIASLESYTDYLQETIEDYRSMFNYIKEQIEDEKRLEAERKRAEEEAKKPATVPEVLDYVRAHGGIESPSKKFDFHTMLWNRFAGTTELPSKKQQYYINVLFKELTGKDVTTEAPSSSSSLDDYPEYEKAIRYIIEHGESSIVKKVCQSVNRYRTFTEKQKHYLDEALMMYKSVNN